jgi:hypothetical protein
MFWKIRTASRDGLSEGDGAKALSRRQMLAGIGLAGACAVAGPALLSSPVAAREGMPAAEPLPEADTDSAEHRHETGERTTEFSSQEWRRRRRRYYRRRRRRSRLVCRRRWRRGRLVRTCRRVWYWR